MEDNAYTLQNPIICIVGPTASGKSELAQRLAEELGGEVVGADSMQVYRGMDIGTGKVPASERRVPHFGLDLVDPGKAYSAALFQAYARTCFKDIDTRHKRSILCGGTGFYVRAAIDAYDFPAGEQIDNPVRERYNTYAREQGAQALWNLLNERDSASAAVIPANDVKRLVRAFELLEEGTSYAHQKEDLANIEQVIPAHMLGLSVDPDILRTRIDKRVDAMLEEGLVVEVETLLERGFRSAITAPQAIGYKEIVTYLDGGCILDEAVKAIKTATHRYAKRQRTWFRKDARITWIDANSLNYDYMVERAHEVLKSADTINAS